MHDFALCACGNTGDDAEDTETETTDTADVDTEETDDGQWTCVEDAFYMYVPADWAETNADGDHVVYAVTNSDGSEAVVVEFYDEAAEEETMGFVVTSIEDLANTLKENGTDADVYSINGIDVLTAVDEGNDASYSYFLSENGLFVVTFYPASSEDYAEVFDSVVGSIMTVEDFEVSGAE